MKMVKSEEMKQMTTKEAVSWMLKENTGCSMLDSGGTPTYDEDGNYESSKHGYGRKYERNSRRNFEKEPMAWMDVYASGTPLDEVIIRGSLYHFLVESLEFSHVKTARFNEFADSMPKESWWEVIEKFLGQADILLDGADGMYTYNFDFQCDQDIVVWQVDIEGEQVVILRSHNGCDARGGFSTPLLFTPIGYPFVSSVISLYENIYCSNCCQGYRRERTEFVDAQSEYGNESLEDESVLPASMDRIKSCLCDAKMIELSPVKQLSLEGEIIYPTKREAMEEAMQSEFGETGDKLLYNEEYDELGSYVQCPSCKMGRLLPSVGILV